MSAAYNPLPSTPGMRPSATSMNVQRRAAAAARIFDVLATVVLIFGGLLVLAQLAGAVAFLAGWAGSDSLDSDMAALGLLVPIGAFVGAIATAIVTAVNWAVITLATAIAGYVAQRSPQL